MKDCLTERPAHFGMLLGYCDHQTHKFMNRLLREYDVSPMQCRTLTFLHDAPGEVNQKTLERHLMVKPSWTGWRKRSCCGGRPARPMGAAVFWS